MSTISINQLFPGQSLHSVIFRAAKNYQYKRSGRLLRVLGVGNGHVISTTNQAVLAAYIGHELVTQLRSTQLTSHLRRHVAICPICLRDAPYHREIWRSNYLPFCPDHHVWLVSKCPNCMRWLEWSRLEDETMCTCGRTLAYIPKRVKLSHSQADLLSVIKSALTDSTDYEIARSRARLPPFIKMASPMHLLRFVAEVHALIELYKCRRLENAACTRYAFTRLHNLLSDWERKYQRWFRYRLKRLRKSQCLVVPHVRLNDGIRSWISYLDSEPYLNDLRIKLLQWLFPFRVIGFDGLNQSTPNFAPNSDRTHEYITVVELSRQCDVEIETIRDYLTSKDVAIWPSDRPNYDVVVTPDVDSLINSVLEATAVTNPPSTGKSIHVGLGQ